MASLAACAIGVTSITFASASPTATSAAKAPVKRIFIKANLEKRKLFFSAPNSVNSGDILKVINQTDPSFVGPHTFSLVEGPVIPDTKQEQNQCFDKGTICREIAGWHKINLKTEAVGANPVKPGRPGWDTEGNLEQKGDSFFFDALGQRFGQKVSVGGPTVISFMCAVHPFMDGSILVKP